MKKLNFYLFLLSLFLVACSAQHTIDKPSPSNTQSNLAENKTYSQMAKLLSDEYIQRRAEEVNLNAICTLDAAKPGLESPNTTHFSIVDRWGNAVSNT
jgi:gamma-glutamyltranspeptidase